MSKSSRDFAVRMIAAILAIGGCVWAAFTLFPIPSLIVFAPDYLVVAAYIARSMWTPPFIWSVLIWILSISVHGAWLCFGLSLTGYTIPQDLISAEVGWWPCALAASVIAIFFEFKIVRA